ncbi:phosphatidate cytidylyltransferase [Aliivibrio fischeri]|uniref:Phosphatidate cytidylyltransferase n=1 Tax=Aliivibrio fischeri SR5 TaxID=1088719 RepID=A0AAV3EUK4_ALIFS|nr:phosphatidate cytidylyltransferase [Aliivibrio fischeri]EHN70403.1 phosphatidate cytidylyltransferase [Aliivibrio fischeri SR5]MUJ18645.1 CDP-diglyceride synthetase [Aliivibrio fischeri]MUJ25962.1 CDP-diglyceride synthetase [Aliivibrio fischeri]MUK27147.1 CDP-diglyceride synthetase [Aliivibrio fischeri]MUK34565.1 CDP-diglyceride synthetase [Aliivibrio fischeri]
MKQRIITALILAPLVIAGIFMLPMQGFLIAITAITLVGFWEWTQFTESKSRYLAIIPSVAVLAASLFFLPTSTLELTIPSNEHQIILLVGFTWWLIASGLVLTFPNSKKLWHSNLPLKHIFGWLTMIPFLWSILLLRADHYMLDSYYGAKLVLLVCLLVWAADSGAYFAGKSFGKRKMSPAVSPNKTIEGLIGGVITAIIIGWGAASAFNIQFESTSSMLGIFIATIIISVLGDLVESMFKRASGIKDSGTIIPGHGGILDRIDSLTAAFPVFAFLYFF